MKIFRLYRGLRCLLNTKTYFEVQVSFGFQDFLQARWTDKIKFGGISGYADPYLEFLIRHFKLFRLHAILHDAAGSVRALCDESLGYCYKIGRGPKSFLLAHVTGLLFAFI